MDILIIEDDDYKAASLQRFIYNAFRNRKTSITVATNLKDAINLIHSFEYDFVLIDMAIPSHQIVSGGGAPVSLLTGGFDVLFELNTLQRKDKSIIVTQYPEIEISGSFFPVREAKLKIKELFGCDVLACIEYSEGDSFWEDSLIQVLN